MKRADRVVLVDLLGVAPLSEPVGLPPVEGAEPESVGMYFLSHALLLALFQDHGDVAGPLLDPGSATLGPRADPPHRGTLVHGDVPHEQVVDVDARLLAGVPILGVRNRRAHELRERARDALRREVEDGERLLDALSADLVRDEPRLPGG